MSGGGGGGVNVECIAHSALITGSPWLRVTTCNYLTDSSCGYSPESTSVSMWFWDCILGNVVEAV